MTQKYPAPTLEQLEEVLQTYLRGKHTLGELMRQYNWPVHVGEKVRQLANDTGRWTEYEIVARHAISLGRRRRQEQTDG